MLYFPVPNLFCFWQPLTKYILRVANLQGCKLSILLAMSILSSSGINKRISLVFVGLEHLWFVITQKMKCDIIRKFNSNHLNSYRRQWKLIFCKIQVTSILNLLDIYTANVIICVCESLVQCTTSHMTLSQDCFSCMLFHRMPLCIKI